MVDEAMVERKFAIGDRVRKHSGSWWEGRVVGFYGTSQTTLGYNVQLDMVPNGPVQIYPEAALEAAAVLADTSPGEPVRDQLAIIKWAHETLYEINPSNYDHDEVCKLNDASVEVILGLAQALGEKHGKTDEWWEQYRESHPLPALADTGKAETLPVAVKPLEWSEVRKDDGSRWRWVAGDYGVTQMDWSGFSSFDISRGNWLAGGPYTDLESAKAAAQADYETRIRSARVQPAPADAAVVERTRREEMIVSALLGSSALRWSIGGPDSSVSVHFIDGETASKFYDALKEYIDLARALSTPTSHRGADGSATTTSGKEEP